MEQLIRMGTFADYKHPYLTLQHEFEARQIEVFAKMAMDGLIFKGLKPVYWSPSSESALADACCPGNPRDTSVEEIKELYKSLL